MDTQALVDELVIAYADILRLTVVVGELAQIDLKKLQESRMRELRLRKALRGLERGGNCWCQMAIGNPMVKRHAESCDFAYSILFGVERERNGKPT